MVPVVELESVGMDRVGRDGAAPEGGEVMAWGLPSGMESRVGCLVGPVLGRSVEVGVGIVVVVVVLVAPEGCEGEDALSNEGDEVLNGEVAGESTSAAVAAVRLFFSLPLSS